MFFPSFHYRFSYFVSFSHEKVTQTGKIYENLWIINLYTEFSLLHIRG